MTIVNEGTLSWPVAYPVMTSNFVETQAKLLIDHSAQKFGSEAANFVAVCNTVASGVVPVAAAGNSSVDLALVEPASYDEVLTATAMAENDGRPGGLGGHIACAPSESDDTPASFSDFATLALDQAHTIAAPGVCVPGFVD
jgi:hypothetical protein